MWEKRPILLLIMATVVLMIGTTVTMIIPFMSINTDEDRIATVKPYTPLQQEGRDIYMREGCNNCHTQTVRPLVPEVLRYGEYSKSGEFVYDRPFLWGSKRTGPDLARVGGKYPDAWHYKHMDSPRAMIPGSNMPDYGWIKKNSLDPKMIQHKMDVLDFPYTPEQIAALGDKNEMDAIVAYLQKLGSDIPWRKAAQTTIVGELKNPFVGDNAAIKAGKELFGNNCAACHGEKREGGIGPDLTDIDMDDDDLYETIHNGISDGGMPAFGSLGSNKIWQLVNFLQSKED